MKVSGVVMERQRSSGLRRRRCTAATRLDRDPIAKSAPPRAKGGAFEENPRVPSTTDVIVLGAGIVGVSAALHLQARGRSVVIVDRLGVVAGETSLGNSGVVQTEAVFPYTFPRAPGEILKAALNRDPRAHIRYSALPSIAPFLWRYFLASSPAQRLAGARAMRRLVELVFERTSNLRARGGVRPVAARGRLDQGFPHLARRGCRARRRRGGPALWRDVRHAEPRKIAGAGAAFERACPRWAAFQAPDDHIGPASARKIVRRPSSLRAADGC